MPFRPTNLVHTDEAALEESTTSRVEAGSLEPGSLSSAVERRLHTADVEGSIPSATTIPYRLLPPRRGRVPKAACCVYLVSAGTDLTKIGMSSNPQSRLSGLRTGNAHKLALEHSWRLENRQQAAALEDRLHKLFRWAKERREWFTVEPRYIIAVANFCLAGDEAQAELLCGLIRQYEEALRLHDQKLRRRQDLNRRWDREERETLADEMDVLMKSCHAYYDAMLVAGLPPCEWDAALASWKAHA